MVDQDEHKEITVETLSTPPIKIAPAPILRRIAAMITDSLVLVILWQSLSIASGQGYEQFMRLPNHVSLSTLALIAFAYYFLLEGLLSASLGKSLIKLTVLEETGVLARSLLQEKPTALHRLAAIFVPRWRSLSNDFGEQAKDRRPIRTNNRHEGARKRANPATCAISLSLVPSLL